jgi:ABC-type Zn uptake system ZnuABC Zn-binding protein ZnuA
VRRNDKKFYPAFGPVAGLALLGGLLSGCANPAPRETEYVPHAGKATVLSSVAVWANIAQTIGGPEVIASAIIAGPNRDPHSYEATKLTSPSPTAPTTTRSFPNWSTTG